MILLQKLSGKLLFNISIECYIKILGFPGSSAGKESACNAGDLSSIHGLGRPPGEGHGNPFQCSCLENPMDRGAWWAIGLGVSQPQESNTTERLSTSQHIKVLWKIFKNELLLFIDYIGFTFLSFD